MGSRPRRLIGELLRVDLGLRGRVVARPDDPVWLISASSVSSIEGELERRGAEVLDEVLDARRARDRHDVASSASSQASASCAGVQPASRPAPRSRRAARDSRRVLGLEARHRATDVLGLEAPAVAQRAGQKAARQRAERDERRADLAAASQHARSRRCGSTASTRSARARSDARHARARSVAADTSDRPMARILPARTSSASAPTLSSIGTRLSQRCR